MKRNSYTVMSQGAQQQLTKLAVVETFVEPKTEYLAHISLVVLGTQAVLEMHWLQYKGICRVETHLITGRISRIKFMVMKLLEWI